MRYRVQLKPQAAIAGSLHLGVRMTPAAPAPVVVVAAVAPAGPCVVQCNAILAAGWGVGNATITGDNSVPVAMDPTGPWAIWLELDGDAVCAPDNFLFWSFSGTLTEGTDYATYWDGSPFAMLHGFLCAGYAPGATIIAQPQLYPGYTDFCNPITLMF